MMRSEWRHKLAALVGFALLISDLASPAQAFSFFETPDSNAPSSNETVLAGISARLTRRMQTRGLGSAVAVSSPKSLDLVSGSGKAFVALAQRDVLSARAKAGGLEHVEVYGRIPACVLVVGRPGWTLDLAGAQSMDIGSENGWTAETIDILRTFEPLLSKARVEHRGGARALDRVQNGEEDVAFLMVYDDTIDPVTRSFLKDGLLVPVPFFGASHVREATKSGLHYQSGQVTVPVAQSWWRQTRAETICTTLGVAVNNSADAALVEQAVSALNSSALDETEAKLWFETLWQKAGRQYDVAVARMRSFFSGVIDAPELKAIATNLGVGDAAPKQSLVRPAKSEDVAPVQSR